MTSRLKTHTIVDRFDAPVMVLNVPLTVKGKVSAHWKSKDMDREFPANAPHRGVSGIVKPKVPLAPMLKKIGEENGGGLIAVERKAMKLVRLTAVDRRDNTTVFLTMAEAVELAKHLMDIVAATATTEN